MSGLQKRSWSECSYEETALGIRQYFLNELHGIGPGATIASLDRQVFSIACHETSYCSDDAVGVAGPDGNLSCRVAREGLPSLAS
jgi:hypothetical protein